MGQLDTNHNKKSVTSVETIADLATVNTAIYKAVTVKDENHGGGFTWWPDLAKTLHDGGIYFDPLVDMTTWTYTSANAGSGVWRRQSIAPYSDSWVSAEWFNSKGDGATDNFAAETAAIAYAETVAGGSQGGVVTHGKGVFLISDTIVLPNRVGFVGANGRAAIFRPHPSFTASYMFHAVNGTSSMFGSYIHDIYIDARGFNMVAPVYSQAWQETCGMKRVVIQFDGTTPQGFLYSDGFGGAAYLPMEDLEIFSDSTAVGAVGIKVNQVSLVGGFVLSIDGITIAGTVANPINAGLLMVNDSAIVKGFHQEYCVTGISAVGAGSISVDTMNGSANAVTDMIAIGSGFTGKVALRNIIPNGATGQTFKNNITGEHIAASEGMLASYDYQVSGFSSYLSANQLAVTGAGAEATVVFDTEVFDRTAEYNNVTGIFTAKRAGKYIFSSCVKFNPTLSVTTCVIKLVTSNRTYHLFRGDTDSLRDGVGTVTLNGSVIADMDINDTAKVTIICSGLAGNTIDILAGESFFQGHWLTR